jgi:predicted ATPase
MGRFSQAREQFEQGWALYDLQRSRPTQAPVARAGQDPGVNCLAMASRALWALGYPDQALKKSCEALTLARDLQHPLSIGFALVLVAMTHHLRREAPEAQEQAEAAIAVCREYGFSFYLAAGTIWQGWALAAQGQPAAGIAQLQQGLAAWRATGAELVLSHYLTALAEAHERAGQIEESLMAFSEALSLAEKHEEHFYEAELYRLKGELTLRPFKIPGSKFKVTDPQSPNPDPQGEAETCFQKALAIARQQEAKSFELRAAMSLARLWQRQGKIAEARELLEDVYDWFTEGFDIKDLQEAAELLVALGGTVERTAEEKRQRTTSNRSLASSVQRLESEEQRRRVTGQTLDPRSSDSRLSNPRPKALDDVAALNPHDLSSLIPHPQSSVPNVFRHDGEYWTLAFEGTTCRVADILGMHYLARLLQHPQQEFHVRILAGEHAQATEHTVSTATRGAEPFLAQLPQAVTQRLQELREELAEAEAFHDTGRKTRLQAELETVTASLLRQTSAVKKAAPTSERLRLNVTRAIKTAIKRITDAHPQLGQYLAHTIKTGTVCSYSPADDHVTDWQV